MRRFSYEGLMKMAEGDSPSSDTPWYHRLGSWYADKTSGIGPWIDRKMMDFGDWLQDKQDEWAFGTPEEQDAARAEWYYGQAKAKSDARRAARGYERLEQPHSDVEPHPLSKAPHMYREEQFRTAVMRPVEQGDGYDALHRAGMIPHFYVGGTSPEANHDEMVRRYTLLGDAYQGPAGIHGDGMLASRRKINE